MEIAILLLSVVFGGVVLAGTAGYIMLVLNNE
jgi:hypothetical protein